MANLRNMLLHFAPKREIFSGSEGIGDQTKNSIYGDLSHSPNSQLFDSSAKRARADKHDRVSNRPHTAFSCRVGDFLYHICFRQSTFHQTVQDTVTNAEVGNFSKPVSHRRNVEIEVA